ncbi:hypothetical protein [Marinobacter sp. X15-166B]|uniref:hypothetical protein n=1 Tax=Marinobacter sp. X15-166B TaxID=1897620 RepID=UPI00085C7F15|nr:hypothetical protein [Marinobacter sp. X15-166B]OEY65408.1 hypothetical protein BG841_02345 [Marinobacter sp. X15-166B]
MATETGFTLRPGRPVGIVSAVCGAALALVMTVTQAAEDMAPEVETAAAHAGFAASAGDIKGVQSHLHHALNCLVGPDGDGFDANELNPCQGMGEGAIPATVDSNQKAHLEAVVATINDGLTTEDYDEAKAAAMSAAKALKGDKM